MGENRTYFESLDAAMQALPVPVERREVVRALVSAGPADIWIPERSPYIAVRPHGEKLVRQYVNKSFVDLRLAPSTYERTDVVGGVAGTPWLTGGSPGVAASARPAMVPLAPASCPVHHVQLPGNGVCDECA